MMCPSPEFATPQEVPNITTIEEAAAELHRLHEALGASAVDYHLVQPDRLPQGFNKDWHWDHAQRHFTPRLAPVQRRHDVIELGAYHGLFSGVEAEYDLQTDPKSELIIQRYGVMLDPGDRYKVGDSQVWRDNHTPFYARMVMNHERGFDPFSAHLWLTKVYTELVEVDNSVLALILDLRAYEAGQS